MSGQATKRLFEELERSLDRFEEALQVPEDRPLAVDGTIQRLEFTFELFWKAVHRLLVDQGIEANSPKLVLQQAYRLGWIDDEPRWMKLLADRNLTLAHLPGAPGAPHLSPPARASAGDAHSLF